MDNDVFYKILFEVNEKTQLNEMKKYNHHGKTSVYDHSVSVAILSFYIADKLGIQDKEDIVIGALLHDYFLYDWRISDVKLHGIKHPRIALRNAQRELTLSPLSEDIIVKHMFPLTILPPLYVESWIVSFADKLCAIHEYLIDSLKNEFIDRRVV